MKNKVNALIVKLEEHLMLLHMTVSVVIVHLEPNNLKKVELLVSTVYLDVINQMLVQKNVLNARKTRMLVKQNRFRARIVLLVG